LKTIVHLQIWIILVINITLKGDSIPQQNDYQRYTKVSVIDLKRTSIGLIKS
jgi:hypothetical protein